MSAATRVLNRLAGVKPVGKGKWFARCPSHEDHSPSLSVRETDDGRLLLHCFGGCGSRDVLDSLGLNFSDLFDKPLAHFLPPVRGGFSARELLEVSSHEATVAALIASDAQGRPLTDEELARLIQAASRLGKAQGLASGC
jgi:hypothetical protein